MKNGWTGGQYSLYRIIFGLYLFYHFVALLPWGPELFSSRGVLPNAADSPFIHLFPNILAAVDSPGFVTFLLIVAIAFSLFFAIGFWDRVASIGLWYLSSCFFGRNPLIANPGLPYIGWLLLAHAFLPGAPYGSWAARGRSDGNSNAIAPQARPRPPLHSTGSPSSTTMSIVIAPLAFVKPIHGFLRRPEISSSPGGSTFVPLLR
jgi:hypothetical protein